MKRCCENCKNWQIDETIAIEFKDQMRVCKHLKPKYAREAMLNGAGQTMGFEGVDCFKYEPINNSNNFRFKG